MPGRDEITKWWNSVQQTLNNANADIDLTRKEDLLRFRIVEYSEIRTEDNSFCDADSSSRLAFVDDKNFDYAKAENSQIIEKQNTSPSFEKIEELYNVAKEGRLFFHSLPERNLQSRQLVVGADGNAEVRPDIDHVTKEMDTCMDCIRQPEPPKKSNYSVSLFTRFLAFFGNKKAKKEIEFSKDKYETAVNVYHERLNNWNASQQMDPDFVKQNHNLALANYTHFCVPMDEVVIEREKKMIILGNTAHKEAVANELTAKADKEIQASSESLSALMSGEPGMTPAKETQIANLLFNQSIKDKIMSEHAEGKLTENNASMYNKQLTVDSPEYSHQRSLFTNSPSFKTVVQQLTNEDIKAMIANPANAVKKMGQQISHAIKDADAKQKSSEPVIPKQNTKDDIKSTKGPALT